MAKATITSPHCSVCSSPNRLAAENALAAGAAVTATARRYGIGHMSLRRHWETHVSDDWKAAYRYGAAKTRDELERLALEDGINVVEGLRVLYANHQAKLIASGEVGALADYLNVAREMRRTLVDLGRFTGEALTTITNVSVTNNINVVSYIAGLGEDLVEAFADDPTALEKLHKVLSRRMNAALPSAAAIEGEFAHVG